MRVLLTLFALFNAFNLTYAKNINDAMNEVLKESQGRSVSKEQVCRFTKKAEVLVLDKIEGKSEVVELQVGKEDFYQSLKIKITKCCESEAEHYAFFAIENLKIKKEVFKGWMFSKNTTKTSLEDPKFDITLLKCL